jgi:hypothetical protein
MFIVNGVNFALGDEGVYSAYANGEYMIGGNGGTCGDLNEGLRVDRGCKTASPIEAKPDLPGRALSRVSRL